MDMLGSVAQQELNILGPGQGRSGYPPRAAAGVTPAQSQAHARPSVDRMSRTDMLQMADQLYRQAGMMGGCAGVQSEGGAPGRPSTPAVSPVVSNAPTGTMATRVDQPASLSSKPRGVPMALSSAPRKIKLPRSQTSPLSWEQILEMLTDPTYVGAGVRPQNIQLEGRAGTILGTIFKESAKKRRRRCAQTLFWACVWPADLTGGFGAGR
jgi:hypothetical protein